MLRRLRILDVAPIPICPPGGGSSTRIYHLLRGLSANHEIRVFSQVRGLRGRSIAAEVDESESFHEHRDRNLLGAAAAELCARSWIRPHSVLSSASMRVTRPRLLGEWLGWADVALIEFPWQFAYCRLAAPELPMVFMSHNVEVLTRTSNAGAAGVNARRSPVLALVRRQERFALTRADLVVCVSEPDRAYFVERLGADPARAVVIPSGADTERVHPIGEHERQELRRALGLPDARTVVFMSGTAKVPDVEGLRWVRRLAERRPAAHLPGRRRDLCRPVSGGKRDRYREGGGRLPVPPGVGRRARADRVRRRNEAEGVRLARRRAADDRVHGDDRRDRAGRRA